MNLFVQMAGLQYMRTDVFNKYLFILRHVLRFSSTAPVFFKHLHLSCQTGIIQCHSQKEPIFYFLDKTKISILPWRLDYQSATNSPESYDESQSYANKEPWQFRAISIFIIIVFSFPSWNCSILVMALFCQRKATKCGVALVNRRINQGLKLVACWDFPWQVIVWQIQVKQKGYGSHAHWNWTRKFVSW